MTGAVQPPTVASVLQSAARRYWWLPVVRGIAVIAFGLVAVIWPHITVAAILWVVAIFAIVDGLLEIFDAIRYRKERDAGLGIVFGVIAIAFGVVALVWPGPTITVFAIVVGIWAVVAGLVQIVASVGLRSIIGSGWAWGLTSGILTLILGILLFVWPKSSLAALVWVVGIWAFVIGIVLVVIGFRVRRLAKAELTV